MSTNDDLRAALEAVIHATDATGIYHENTGKGVGDQTPALGYAGGEYGGALLDIEGEPVSAEVLAIIESAVESEIATVW